MGPILWGAVQCAVQLFRCNRFSWCMKAGLHLQRASKPFALCDIFNQLQLYLIVESTMLIAHIIATKAPAVVNNSGFQLLEFLFQMQIMKTLISVQLEERDKEWRHQKVCSC